MTKEEKQDLTTGSLGKKILFFSLPLMCSNLLQVLFNMADIAVVGQFVGSAALGAVGSTVILVGMFTGFLFGLSGGILVLLQTKPELLAGATLYIRIYFLGMPALAIYNFGNAVFSAIGNTKKPLLFLTAAGLQNVIFQFANLFVQAGVNSFSATMVSGNSAAANADPLVYDVMIAFYTACGSFMGQNFGARKRKRVLQSYLISLGYSFGVAVVLGGGLVLAGPTFLV